jgi:hypothetical protein
MSSQPAPPPAEPAAEGPERWRLVVARILVVLGALIALVAVIAGYVRWQALDTDTFEETTGRLIADDDIRNQIAASLVEQLFANVDVAAELEEALPESQQRLAGPLAAASRELADRSARRLLERPRAQEVWQQLLVRTQRQLVRLLDDDLTTVQTEGGFLVLNLQPLVVQLGERVAVVSSIGTRLPEDAGRIRIMEADNLETAQDLTQLFKSMATWLWVVPILLWGAALWLARGRRRIELRAIAVAAILVGLLILLVRSLAGRYVVENLVESESVRPAAQDAWTIITDLLADGGKTVVGIGLILLLGVWLAGETTSGTAARRWLAPVLARPGLTYGLLAAFILLLVWWGPTVQMRRPVQVLALAIILALGLEGLRRLTVRDFPEAAAIPPGEVIRAPFRRLRRGKPEPVANEGDTKLEQLERLGRLRESGVLTAKELAAAKTALLGAEE